MRAYDIIDRLARLDEGPATLPEEPDVMPEEPGTAPTRPAPSREPAPNPWTAPPDFDPSVMPGPKAEDETEEIESWLTATQQPVQDWQWDGENLRLMLDDGTVEVYTRAQLQNIGVFSEVAFSESEEEEEFSALISDGEPGGEPSDGPAPESADSSDASGTLDAILGRNAGSAAPAEIATTTVVLDGPAAEKVADAVDAVVAAILGTTDASNSGDGEGKDKTPAKKDEKKEDDEKDSEGKTEKNDAKSKDKESESKDDDDDDDE